MTSLIQCVRTTKSNQLAVSLFCILTVKTQYSHSNTGKVQVGYPCVAENRMRHVVGADVGHPLQLCGEGETGGASVGLDGLGSERWLAVLHHSVPLRHRQQPHRLRRRRFPPSSSLVTDNLSGLVELSVGCVCVFT